ncbi:MAG: hypothetical protein B6I31_04925 [Desulfobacteraceae bacterium 4572_19]|nr:MAG: hypothetical protein B6I31_04925 [Desulfobacteraceae bacterium 4572_19]
MRFFKNTTLKKKTVYLILFFITLVLVVVFAKQYFKTNQTIVSAPAIKKDKHISQKKVKIPVTNKTVLDYNNLENDQKTIDITNERKLKYGVDGGIDLIVRSDEKFKVGKVTISMQEILEKAIINKGGLLERDITNTDSNANINSTIDSPNVNVNTDIDTEITENVIFEKAITQKSIKEDGFTKEDSKNISKTNIKESERSGKNSNKEIKSDTGNGLTNSTSQTNATEKEIKEYGIYVVQAGDNIWNIHFRLLKDYFNRKGIVLTSRADEPTKEGFSSGIGKLLKFSEQMVSIYNILEHKIDFNLNIIEPMSKIVVYNMNEVFSMLNQIDYSQADNIQFDGETIWLPAQQ